MQPSDSQLLLQYAQQASQDAFRQLVERHTKLVYSVCYRRLHDVQLAEDATQQVFLGLAAQAKRPKRGPLDGYLVRIAYKVTFRMRRNRDNRERFERDFMNAQPLLNLPTRTDPRMARLQQALMRLGEIYREAVTLRYAECMSIQSISVALDVPPSTVRKRLLRALTQLRETMESDGPCLSLAVAAGMLGQVDKVLPRADLAERIVAYVASAKPAVAAPVRPRRSPGLLPRLAVGLGAASAVAAIVTLRLLPGTAPSSPPVVQRSGGFSSGLEDDLASLSFDKKLRRRIADWDARPIPLEFAVRTLQDTSGVTIRPQWTAIEAAGVGRDTHVTFHVTNTNVLGHLEALLKAASPDGRLEYLVSEEQSAIIIRPRAPQENSTSAVISALR